MEEPNPGQLPPYQPAPNVPPPPSPAAPPSPPASGFGTVTPGAHQMGAPGQGGYNTAVPPGGFQPPEKKSRLGLILGVVGVFFLLLVIGAIVAFVLFARNLDSDDFGTAFSEDAQLEDTVSVSFSEGGEIQVDGQIGEGRFDSIEVTLSEGQGVLVTALQGDSSVDTVLTVRDPSGSQIARNDDANGVELPSSLDSQVSFTAASSGTYSIELSDFANNSSGSYQIIIEDG